MDKYPESVQALWDAGMEIGNHSNDHPHMAELSEKKILDEVSACNEKIAGITGESPTLFRCPYGEYDDEVITTVNGMGMYSIQWNVERSHTGERRRETEEMEMYDTREQLFPCVICSRIFQRCYRPLRSGG